MAAAHTDPPAHAGPRSASSLSLILSLAGVVVIAVGLRAISGIFAPAFFALTLILAARPVQRWLVRHRWPPVLAATLVLLSLYVILLVLITALGLALRQLYDTVPSYFDEFGSIYADLMARLSGLGVAQEDVDSLLGSLQFGNVVTVLGDVLDSLSAAGAQLVVVVLVMFFLAFDSLNAGRRWHTLAAAKPEMAEALTHFAVGVRKYWLVSTLFGLIVAVIDVAALLALGVPLALTWGLLAFVTNYIPNVGFVLGLVPPALLALLDSGPVTMVWVIVIYSVVNFTIQSLIQPKFTGDAVGLSPTVTFLSLVFWAIVVGPLGALLAVPLTLFAKAILIDPDPSARWTNAFLVTGREVRATAPARRPAGEENPRAEDEPVAAELPPILRAGPPVDGPAEPEPSTIPPRPR
ncbi:MAG: AI-2E family transporter [Georgenia sp.]